MDKDIHINNQLPLILTVLTFLPLVVALLMLLPFWQRSQFKLIATGVAAVDFVLSLLLLPTYNYNMPVLPGAGMTQMQFEDNIPWLSNIGINYHTGIDGLAMLLIILTTLLTLISILVSWSPIQKREREYYIWLLVLETGMMGVFVSLDFFLFYIFWEVDAGPDGAPDRHLGQQQPGLRGGQVLPVYPGRLAADAGGHHRALSCKPARSTSSTLAADASADFSHQISRLGVPGLRGGLRGQGADVAVPYLAARRARARLPPRARSSWRACC